MPKLIKAPAEGQKVTAGKTLADLATEAGPGIDWKMIASLNWGTDRPAEVVRAIMETIGADLKDLSDKAKCEAPETIPFKPHNNVEAKLRIPKTFKVEGLAIGKTHVLKLKKMKPAIAVSIEKLDKWFIPETEECEIEYELSGLTEVADKVRVDVFASNYCECSDWNDGVGKYAKGELEKEPVYTKAGLKADKNAKETIKWKGDCTTKKGMLGVKLKDDDKRHINVAFSPYTVQFTYHKADMPETNRPQLVVQPFWPQWDLEPKTPVVTAGLGDTSFEIYWKNEEDQEGLAIEVQDKEEVVVFRKSISPKLKTTKEGEKDVSKLERDDLLKKGDRKFLWDKKYRDGILNGEMQPVAIDDSAWSEAMQRQLLYQSTPYKAIVTTLKPKLKVDSLKIKYKVMNSGGKLKRGFYRIKDRTGRAVFYEPLSVALMADGEHELTWDGKYPAGVKNTLDGDEITRWDMPYRIEIQAHTAHGEAEGLALAVKHSEVRLYTHEDSVALLDPRYDSDDHKAGLLLEAGPLLAKAELEGDVDLKPFVPPKDKSSDAWFRYKLAESGYYPGPLDTTQNTHLETSIAEFKRSVPKEGTDGAAGGFTRLDLTQLTARNAETKTALEKIRAQDRRRMLGDPTKIDSNSDAPYFESDFSKPYHESDAEKNAIRDPEKDVVIWADDRQYYTDPGTQPKNDQNQDFFAATGGGNANHRINLGLNNYRGGMVNADGRVDRDATDIPRPHLPFRATPTLMSREDELFTPYKKERVELKDEKLKQARAAIGPLRIDWSVEELPFDLSNLDPAGYPAANFAGTQAWDGKTETRTRRYLTWALWTLKAKYERKETKRKAIATNSPDDMGGVRPKTNPETYAQAVFGTGELKLWPWKAEYDSDTQAVKTITHDLIHKDQKTKGALDKPLVTDETGSACTWFRPSRVAGDGYRIAARVVFKKESATDSFPNLETLEKRYPVTPVAHSAKLRVWRRSSFRGFNVWAHIPGKFDGAMINNFRDYYKVGHVYFVHEGGTKNDITAASIDGNKFKDLVGNNLEGKGLHAYYTTKANLQKDNQYPYPYCHHDDLGVGDMKPIAEESYFNDTAKDLWNDYNGALLYFLAEKAEADGYMRGHLIAEFKSSPEYTIYVYDCDTTPAHRFCTIRLSTAAAPHADPGFDFNCPDCAGSFANFTSYPNRRFNFNGIGLPLGVTWCFFSDDANIAVHEVGHHRHFEHSANGPFIKPAMHDHAKNEVVNWTTDAVAREIWWDDVSHRTVGDGEIADGAAHQDHGKRWDRRCIMSYANNSPQYFCGKCVLRNRGWKVTNVAQLAEMNPLFREPA